MGFLRRSSQQAPDAPSGIRDLLVWLRDDGEEAAWVREAATSQFDTLRSWPHLMVEHAASCDDAKLSRLNADAQEWSLQPSYDLGHEDQAAIIIDRGDEKLAVVLGEGDVPLLQIYRDPSIPPGGHWLFQQKRGRRRTPDAVFRIDERDGSVQLSDGRSVDGVKVRSRRNQRDAVGDNELMTELAALVQDRATTLAAEVRSYGIGPELRGALTAPAPAPEQPQPPLSALDELPAPARAPHEHRSGRELP